MRKLWLSTVVIGLLTTGGMVLAGGEQNGEMVLKKIQGTWRFVSEIMDGKPLPAEDVKKLTITFSGDKWTVRADDKVVQAGTHKFDPTKQPGHIDAKVTEGQGKGSAMLGIYEMKGDSIRVCFDPQGKERPTSLTAKEGQFSAVIQREKKKP